MKNVSRYLLMLAAFGLFVGTPSAQTPTYPYDHIHLNVPDPAVAVGLVREEHTRRPPHHRGARSHHVRQHAFDVPEERDRETERR